MSDKNQAVVRRAIDELWNKGNLNIVDELFTPDHLNDDPVNNVRGGDGLREVVKKYRAAFPDCRLEIDEIFSAGDNVVVRWHYSGTHKNTFEGIPPTGRRATGPGLSIHRFAGDRIKESHTVWDALGMMQQLGLVTLPGKTTKAGL